MALEASGFFAGQPEDQWEWHETFRDSSKNMYRTSYTDMSHGREVCVRSDLPSGYGGHVPSVRHDVLFRNTAFDRETVMRRTDANRDAFPSFQDQTSGIPTYTRFPQGAKRTPTYGITPHNGTTTMLKPPWGILTTKNEPLNHRTTPRTTPRLAAGAMTPRSGMGASSGLRVNETAVKTGTMLFSPDMMATPRPPSGAAATPPPGASASARPSSGPGFEPTPSPAASDRLRQSVRIANQEAEFMDMPTEADILHRQLHG